MGPAVTKYEINQRLVKVASKIDNLRVMILLLNTSAASIFVSKLQFQENLYVVIEVPNTNKFW